MLRNVATLALASTIGCNASLLEASPVPVHDIIDLCSHAVGDREYVAAHMVTRGWMEFNDAFPEWIPNMLADGQLLQFFTQPPGNERANGLGVDKQTGTIPDMAIPMQLTLKNVRENKYDVLWNSGDTNTLLFIFDPAEVGVERGLMCRLYGDGSPEIEFILEAFAQAPDYVHHTQIEQGPVELYRTWFRGMPPHEPLGGALGVLVDLGILVDRPIIEVQLGAGPSHFRLFVANNSDFRHRFGRETNASFVITITREPPSEAHP